MSSIISTVQKTVADSFRGLLKTGTLRREVPGTGVDTVGDPNPGTVQTFTLEGIRDDFSDFYRAQAGIPKTDVKLVIIAGLLSTTPVKGDQIFLENTWFEVRRIRTDPATAAWELQSFEIPDPTA